MKKAKTVMQEVRHNSIHMPTNIFLTWLITNMSDLIIQERQQVCDAWIEGNRRGCAMETDWPDDASKYFDELYNQQYKQPEPDSDFIKIPRKDFNGFVLPLWVKPGVECIFEGQKRIIDFVGLDEGKAWCCRLHYDGDNDKGQWAFVSNIKPYNG